MPKNEDNARKAKRGGEVKNGTLKLLESCEVVNSISRGAKFNTGVEKASCDAVFRINSHDEVLILITTTSSFRDDRLDTANTRMKRYKKHCSKQFPKAIGIVTSTCDNERTNGDDGKLLNGYNFGDREEIGLDILVKADDLVGVIQQMSQVEDKNDVQAIINAAKGYIKKKNY